MSDAIIKVEGISKKYRIHHEAPVRQSTLRDVIADRFNAMVNPKRNAKSSSASDEDFWALKNVSFEVGKGEVVGVIGRNGAGKSTLLKILSRITEPTSGRITLQGRVASLLEVGTGFHPELTGRENIYLNGAILGMSKVEIRSKFDEIVAFAEVEQFLDTPVKRYSSGMYVRLAFAVAAHLEPEILIVDEVLAVGDVDFQRKCIGAMQTIAAGDRTVLLVSHNLALMRQLCSRCVVLDRGEITADGAPERAIEAFQRSFQRDALLTRDLRPAISQRGKPHFQAVEFRNSEGIFAETFHMGEEFEIVLKLSLPQIVHQPWIGIQFRTESRELVCHLANREAGCDLAPISGEVSIVCRLPAPRLQASTFIVDLILSDASNNVYHHVENACRLQIQPYDIFKTGMPMDGAFGIYYEPSIWHVLQQV